MPCLLLLHFSYQKFHIVSVFLLQVFVDLEPNRPEITSANYPSSIISHYKFPNCAVQNFKVLCKSLYVTLFILAPCPAIRFTKPINLNMQRTIWLLGCLSCCCSKPLLPSNLSRSESTLDHNKLNYLSCPLYNCITFFKFLLWLCIVYLCSFSFSLLCNYAWLVGWWTAG